jgi:hypothetical protein
MEVDWRSRMADQKTPTPAEITIMAGGAVALVGSFFTFIGNGDFGVSAWGGGNFPVVTLMALFAFVMAVQIALTKFTGVNLPSIPGFTWVQVHLALGFFAALYALGFLIVKISGEDRKIGFWLVFIGCIGAFVGAILLSKERSGGAPAA